MVRRNRHTNDDAVTVTRQHTTRKAQRSIQNENHLHVLRRLARELHVPFYIGKPRPK